MVEVKLHDIGEGMHEADITHFFVKVGDRVKADQPLVEVQTDKMTAEIPSPANGVIKELKVEEGENIPVGTTVLVLEVEGSSAETEAAVAIETISEEEVMNTEEVSSNKERKLDRFTVVSPKNRVKAAPYTRKVARELGIMIEEVAGTGKGGRITVEDVERYAEEVNNPNSTPSTVEFSEQTTQQEEQVNSTPTNVLVSEKETIPFRGRRKQIAKKMTQSLYTIPHCTHFEEIDVTELIELRKELKAMDANVSATAFFIKAISIALKQFPIFNAKLDEENEMITLEKEHHIGIATDTEDGLIVPVIRNVEKKSLKEIHEGMKALTKKAQEGTLTLSEMTGGTFTISNVGPLGGSIGATPIINHPEVGLMAFHKTKRMPVVRGEDEIVIRSMMNISMAFDHRVTDGATAVSFTNLFTKLIENPNMMMIEM
jgi:2-oxoisovalerate dehydrogenase E2 component (dihydrolipoyl transacylase)